MNPKVPGRKDILSDSVARPSSPVYAFRPGADVLPSRLVPGLETIASTLVIRNITVAGRRTSVRLEPEMWSGLHAIARREGGKIHDVCTMIFTRKLHDVSLTAAIRVFIMGYFRDAATEEGHMKAGHGRGGLFEELAATEYAPARENDVE